MNDDRFDYFEGEGILGGLLAGAFYIGITALAAPALAEYLFGDSVRSFFDNNLIPDTIMDSLCSIAVMGLTTFVLGKIGFGWRGIMMSTGIWGALGGLIIVNIISPEKTFSIGLSFLVIWIIMTIYEHYSYDTPGIPVIPAIWFTIMIGFGILLYVSSGDGFNVEDFTSNDVFLAYFIPVFLVVAAPGIGEYGIHFAIGMEILGIIIWGYACYTGLIIEGNGDYLSAIVLVFFFLMICISPLISYLMMLHRDEVEYALYH